MPAQGFPEAWAAVKDIAAVLTPFAVFWLGLRSSRRKTLLDSMNENIACLNKTVASTKESFNQKIDEVKESLNIKIETAKEGLHTKIDHGNKTCREDVHAMTVQISAFQREVAERYVGRSELLSTINDVRNDVRALRGFK